MGALEGLKQKLAQFTGLDSAVAKELAKAEVLAGRGRYDEAIDQLSKQNRLRRDARLEKELVCLRHAGYAHVAHASARPDWPPPFPDPFPPGTDLPEVSGAKGLTPELIGGAILHHGGLIVRGLISDDEAQHLKQGIELAFQANAEADRGRARRDGECWYSPLALPDSSYVKESRLVAKEVISGVFTGDSPRMLFEVIDLLKSKGVDRAIAGYLGERPALSMGKSTLRRTSPKVQPGDWHQDGAFLGKSIRTVNLWLGLSHCGDEAASLDVVPRRLEDLVETGTHGAYFDWTVGHEKAVEAAGDRPIRHLSFAPGDAMFFDQLFLHRTSGHERLSKDRHAIETWFFAPSTYPLKWEPLLF